MTDDPGADSDATISVAFVCVENAGRSQMAAAFAERELAERDLDGEIAIRKILPLSLTYDHRLIDGARAQRFLNEVIVYLEDHGRLLVR